MIIKSCKDVLSEFRKSRGQIEESPKTISKVSTRKNSNKNTPYNSFLIKYSDMENNVESFNTRDFVYYFREIAEENGYKYTISNIQKDMAIFKRLRESYLNIEICGMIEFLYESEQDYLSKDRLSPNLLASRWVNTIYADMKLWIENKYIPKSKNVKKFKGEWHDSIHNSGDTIIGLKF